MANTKNLTQWSASPPPSLSDLEIDWLFVPGSLTSKLQALGSCSLKLVNQYEDNAIFQDALILQQPIGSPIWIREVVMYIDARPCVTARSITASHSLQQGWKILSGYGDSPLSDILYDNINVERTPFECAQLAAGDPLKLLSRRYDTKSDLLNARRSGFRKNNDLLVISECFLNDFWLIASKKTPRF